MSQENVEIVRRLYEAWNQGDLDSILLVMHPEIEIDYKAGAFPGVDDAYTGHDGVPQRGLLRPRRSPQSRRAVGVGHPTRFF